jgi:hypothetical protein
MKIRDLWFWILISFFSTVTASAFEIGVGVSVSKKNLSVFNESGTELASLEGDSGFWPYISIKTDDKYFGDSSFGYFYYGWYTQDAVDKVKNQQEMVLPSPVRLAFLYAGATVFYTFGSKLVTRDNGQSQHAIGLGGGWGASKINGSIPAAYTNNGVDQTIDSYQTGSSANIFYRYLWGEMVFMFDASTVQVRNGGRRYDTTETSITLGRYFDF